MHFCIGVTMLCFFIASDKLPRMSICSLLAEISCRCHLPFLALPCHCRRHRW